jgi:hypothetical protein
LKKVHNIVSFKQKDWLKPYVYLNTEKVKEASKNKNEFEKDFFKSMILFLAKQWKTSREEEDIHATTSEENAIKWFSKVHMKELDIQRDLIY